MHTYTYKYKIASDFPFVFLEETIIIVSRLSGDESGN